MQPKTNIPKASVDSLLPDRSPPPMLNLIGPFLGVVLENDDQTDKDGPLGRLKVYVPQVYGEEYRSKSEDLPWARPLGCFLAGAKPDGKKRGSLFIPLKEMCTYVFFEAGDINCPLWFGGWYGKQDGKEEMPTQFTESDYGVQYPDIAGFSVPPLYIRLHGIRIPVAATVEWIEDEDRKVLVEIDKEPMVNDAPTVRVELFDDDWELKIKVAGKMSVEAKELTLTAEKLSLMASEELKVETIGPATYSTAGTERHIAGRLTGEAQTVTGFDSHS